MHKILFWSGFGRFQLELRGFIDDLRHRLSVCHDRQLNLRTDEYNIGIGVRLWQLGIEMRPLFHPKSLWVYPVYAGIGGSVGYMLMGVEERQTAYLTKKRDSLMEKRKRRAERAAADADNGLVELTTANPGLREFKEEPVMRQEAVGAVLRKGAT